MNGPRADDWRDRGGYFSWRPAEKDVSSVEIFHVELGDPGAPVLLLIHGWPTSSIDWFEVAGRLSERFRVCALDFPGYGFSDKPPGWGYSLSRDEELIEFYLSEVIGAAAGVVVAHDRGDSVALLHAARCAEGRSAMRLEHLVLSNGNIFLPMSNLTQAQRLILDGGSWPQAAAALTPARLAEAMGATTFTPPRTTGDPEVEALTATFGHDNGIRVLHETIQYLVERSKDEQRWLTALAAARFPVTVIWGLYDTVSPPRVASYVWNEYLMLKPGGNRLYFIPDANHYLQVDRPDAFVKVLLHALEPADDQGPGALDTALGAPLLVDSSRQRLQSAADLLRSQLICKDSMLEAGTMAEGSATQFAGVSYVGALFDSSDGQPTTHFATAFVVSSKHGNMLMSAAHVLNGRNAPSIIFAPGYASGQAVHDLWHVQKAYTDSAWQANQSIDDDFCFLKVGADVQGRVGSLNLLTGVHPQTCSVIGYPDGLTSPVQATVQAAWYTSGHQLKFTCNGYPNGTSGSPWIINGNSACGLIGGYQQGGATPSVSYSPYFGANVRNLYDAANEAFL